MNERGFFTIIGLCLLLAVAISIQGVEEFEGNYSIGTANSRTEQELQNLAESALFLAKEKINGNELENTQFKIDVGSEIISERLKKLNAAVEVWGEKTTIHIKKGEHFEGDFIETEVPGTVIISVASCDSPQISGKIYRKVLAYVLDDDSEKTVHFMNDL